LGVVHVRQAEALGIARQTLARRAAEGGWKRLHPGVYLLPAFVADYRTRVSAALLALGPGAAAGGPTAAALWGLVEGEREPLQVLLPHDRPVRALDGVRVVRSRSVTAGDIVRLGPLAVTTIDRTLCDLAGVLVEEELREAVALAGQRSMQWPRRAAARAAELPRLAGRAALLTAIRDVLGEGRTDSTLERRLRRILKAHGLHPAPGVYPLIVNGRLLAMLDIAFPELRLAVEADGFAFHATPAQLRADHARQNRIAAAGWTILRVGKEEVAAGAEHLVSEIAARAAAADEAVLRRAAARGATVRG
ncbi:MAG TPA: type IV toxin-antitoxin system AbiEi family antitoxin domain-containing protein, partial [Egibacteraceae bacterium]|nr:type IV toxin-antitoxin system AbiEi family antitoxin domain-containing protein [Egibacteraceae bacterium]